MAPTWNPEQKGVKVQIVDVFALELATGYDKDPEGRLLLSSEPSVSAGRTWSLAKACQLVRNDKQPHRWVVLHRHKKAWGLSKKLVHLSCRIARRPARNARPCPLLPLSLTPKLRQQLNRRRPLHG